MGGSQKGLVAIVVGAFEESLIVVRAQMLLQTRRTVECLCAAVEWAVVSFQLRRILGGGGREGRCWGLVEAVIGLDAFTRRYILSI